MQVMLRLITQHQLSNTGAAKFADRPLYMVAQLQARTIPLRQLYGTRGTQSRTTTTRKRKEKKKSYHTIARSNIELRLIVSKSLAKESVKLSFPLELTTRLQTHDGYADSVLATQVLRSDYRENNIPHDSSVRAHH